jgi:hypothetical protein
MIASTLWMDTTTNVKVQVQQTFEKLLDESLHDEIKEITCGYNMFDDTVDFIIERRRDNLKARFKVRREKLIDAEVPSCVAAFREEADQFAKLILFLA